MSDPSYSEHSDDEDDDEDFAPVDAGARLKRARTSTRAGASADKRPRADGPSGGSAESAESGNEAQVRELKAALADWRTRAQNAETRLANGLERAESAHTEHEKDAEQQQDLMQEIDRLGTRVATLTREKDAADADRLSLRDKYKDSLKAEEGLRKELGEARARERALRADAVANEVAVAATGGVPPPPAPLQAELDSTQRQLDAAESSLSAAKQENTRLTAALAQKAAAVQELTNEVTAERAAKQAAERAATAAAAPSTALVRAPAAAAASAAPATTALARRAGGAAPSASVDAARLYDLSPHERAVGDAAATDAPAGALVFNQQTNVLSNPALAAAGVRLCVRTWVDDDSPYRPRNAQQLRALHPTLSKTDGAVISVRDKEIKAMRDAHGYSLSFPHTIRLTGDTFQARVYNRAGAGVIVVDAAFSEFDHAEFMRGVNDIVERAGMAPIESVTYMLTLAYGGPFTTAAQRNSCKPLFCTPDGDDSVVFHNTPAFCAPNAGESWRAHVQQTGEQMNVEPDNASFNKYAHFFVPSAATRPVNYVTGDADVPFVQTIESVLTKKGEVSFKFKMNDDLNARCMRNAQDNLSLYITPAHEALQHVDELSARTFSFMCAKAPTRSTGDLRSKSRFTATPTPTPAPAPAPAEAEPERRALLP